MVRGNGFIYQDAKQAFIWACLYHTNQKQALVREIGSVNGAIHGDELESFNQAMFSSPIAPGKITSKSSFRTGLANQWKANKSNYPAGCDVRV
jgi:hypothetical protein